ncbi:MAG: cytochrome c biogenesis protein CcdA [Candidatus Thermoplasmatota archaeon]|nr:cytochrome c biogenesis protein CcdA [Candidatus Thermoplasmatota archaeon]
MTEARETGQVDASGATARLALLTLATVALILLVIFGSRLITPPGVAGAGSTVPLWALLPVAYLGGVFALLSPCSGAILPAFFAYSFQTPGRLVRMTYVFYLGLALVFVPVSGASTLVNSFILDNSNLIFAIGGGLLIAFGLVALAGFDLGRITSKVGFEPSTFGQDRVNRAKTEEGKVYLMGAVFGFATSSCTAPIVSSLIALSVTSGLTAVAGILLFLVFALGIVTPLFLLALLFEKRDIAQRITQARPITLRLAGREHAFHPVHLASGIALILLGTVFIAFRGTLDLTHYYTAWGLADAYLELNLALQAFFATGTGQALAALLLAAIAGSLAWLWRRRRAARDA